MLESRWFISRVTARAFKSVGSCRLNVSFKPGLTCIVGPNGSGKSNLLDAVCFACGSSPLLVGVRRLADLQCTDVQEVRRQIFGNNRHAYMQTETTHQDFTHICSPAYQLCNCSQTACTVCDTCRFAKSQWASLVVLMGAPTVSHVN